MIRRSASVFCLFLLASWLADRARADWPRFLGPQGNNVSAERGLPATFSATEDVAWKTPLPGFGGSSPVVAGGRIYLTAYSGYGLSSDKPGNVEDLKHHVLCLERASGKVVWEKTTPAAMPEQAYGGFIALHGYASGTPAVDDRAVYVFFGRSGVTAYSLAGEKLWQADVGSKTHGWGSGTSPILVGDLLIVNASVESGALVALNKKDGKQVWKVEDVRDSWSTPAVLTLPSGKKELVVSLHSKAWGIDPASGEKLWECAAVPDYVCPAVVTHGDVAFVSGGRKPVTLAVRGGGRGDVTATHKLWEIKDTPKVPSPLYFEGRLYWVSDPGVACCVKADNGETVYKERLSGLGRVYATALAADGKLFVFSREKGAVVLALGPEFKELARNDLGDPSVFNASPVADGGQLIVRSDKFLYCLGKK